MRKFLISMVTIVFSIIGTVVGVGWSLPVAHSAARTVTLAAPPETVFDIVTDFSGHPSWRSDITRVEVEGEPGVGQLVREFGADGELPYRVTALQRPTLVVTRIEAGLPFGGAWTYYFAEAPNGDTRLTIAEDGEIYNLVFRFLARFVFGYEATIDRYLGDLTRKVGQ